MHAYRRLCWRYSECWHIAPSKVETVWRIYLAPDPPWERQVRVALSCAAGLGTTSSVFVEPHKRKRLGAGYLPIDTGLFPRMSSNRFWERSEFSGSSSKLERLGINSSRASVRRCPRQSIS